MEIRKFINAAIVVLIAALSAPVYASAYTSAISPNFSGDVLYKNPSLNKKLETGEFDFSNQKSRYGSSFNDRWKFTVATNSTASISIYDMQVNLGKAESIKTPKLRRARLSLRNTIDTTKIFDTKYLSLSIFNQRGNLIGKTDENGVLANLNLLAGKWYTIQVNGKVSGYFGGAYRGVLDINPTPVPLGDSAPMLGSALALLAFSYRKRFIKNA